jgi:hypothetical protein
MSIIRRTAPLVLLVLVLAGLRAEDAVLEDRWYIGDLRGQPLLNLHETLCREPDGRLVADQEIRLVLRRTIGRSSAAITMTSSGRFWQDDAGRVVRFALDEDLNGTRTVAKGVVADGAVVATVFRLGRSRAVRLELPPDRLFLGWKAEHERLLATCRVPGDAVRSCLATLQNGDLVLSLPTTTLREVRDDRLLFAQVDDLIPSVTTTLLLDRRGELVESLMAFGGLSIRVLPAKQPAVLGDGADLDMAKIFTTVGQPLAAGANAYRLEGRALAAVATTGYQRLDGERLVVASACPAMDPPDLAPYLQATAQLETDAPELVAWVGSLLAGADEDVAIRAELLRNAVRSHISRKDLQNAAASALETFRAQAGDCTEHAGLLCAALRIAGIPAAVRSGIVYAPTLGGWVGHAWTDAWSAAERRWLHLDAAYPGIDRSNYIACRDDAGTPGTPLIDSLAGLMGTTITALGRPAD